MRLLAVDTLGAALSAALTERGELLTERAERSAHGQAERVLPLLEEVLDAAGWSWRDPDLLALTIGPGGFTAIRTGLAVIRALALAIDRPVVAVGTLEAIAEAAVDQAGPGPLLALKDLRREQLAVQAFGPDLAAETDVRLLAREEALAMAARAPRLAGEEAGALAAFLEGGKPAIEVGPAARYVARAACRRLGRGERPVAGTEVRPFYLRAPDAQPAAGKPLVAALAAT